MNTVKADSNSITQQLAHRSSTILLLAESLSPNQGISTLYSLSPQILNTFDVGIALFSPSEELTYASDDITGWQLPSGFTNKFLATIQKNDQAYFSESWTPETGANPRLLVAAKEGDGNTLVGAFTPALLIKQAILGSVDTNLTTVLVVSPSQNVLFQSGSALETSNIFAHPGITESLKGESGVIYFPSSQGEHVVAYSNVEPLGWGVVLEEAWEKIDNPLLRNTQLAPLVLVPILTLAVASIFFGIQQIVRPLQSLERLAGKLAGGDFKSIENTVGGVSEIRNLQRTLIIMAQNLHTTEEDLHHYIGVMTDSQEDEKKLLAREIHDQTIQDLVALNQRIQLSRVQTKDKKLTRKLDELSTLTQTSISDLKRIIRGLRPIYLEDFGLAPALEMLANEANEKGQTKITFSHAEPTKERLKPELELSLYRIAQEALQNIQKHSRAKHASLTLTITPKRVVLTVEDDGVGFKPRSGGFGFARKGHYGVLGMQERADLINGHMAINSTPGKGTRISLTVKLS